MEKKKFSFEPLPKVSKEEKKTTTTTVPKKVEKKTYAPKKRPQSDLSRITFFLEEELKDKMQDYAYWEGYTQQEIINMALEQFLKTKKPNPRPEAVKNRKLGRKRK